MLIDAHTHLTKEDFAALPQFPTQLRLLTSCTTPEEAEAAFGAEDGRLLPTVGVHPWWGEQVTVEELLPYVTRCAAIGEIGLDSVWCDVPLDLQRQIFRRQLELAERLSKPVVLHLKGREAEGADILREFPGLHKLVHWYSSMEHLDAYLKLDCWFTVGPDLRDEAVLQVLRRVPLERLLVESDGRSAVAWATGRRIDSMEYGNWLRDFMVEVAKRRGISPAVLEIQMERNLCAFLSAGPVR